MFVKVPLGNSADNDMVLNLDEIVRIEKSAMVGGACFITLKERYQDQRPCYLVHVPYADMVATLAQSGRLMDLTK